ncbi:MAG: thioredoxin-disulfide reductase [Elusimicrobia bacterium]|nr:thioredoxin-disulfide reductase [Elusimicrobiota bacterium]
MTENPNSYDIIIIGAGPAGMTAAVYCARGGAKTLVFGGIAPGGQLLMTTEIENFPGFPKPVAGPDLMQNMLNQAKRLGAEVIHEEAADVKFDKKPYEITSAGENSFYCKAVIIASGARARWLNLESEQKFIGKGVSACATCDGAFFRNKEVCVIGGGDTAAEDAVFLTKFAARVYLIHRRDKLRTAYRLQERLKNPKIELVYDSVLEQVMGDKKVSGVKIKNVKTGQIREIPAQGVFIAIGHEPETKLFRDSLKTDEKGYILTDGKTRTSIEGVFAAGDVADPLYKQAVIASGTGCMAALEALKYIENTTT